MDEMGGQAIKPPRLDDSGEMLSVGSGVPKCPTVSYCNDFAPPREQVL